MMLVPNLVETFVIQDVFAGRLARIDSYDGSVRLVFSQYQPIGCENGREIYDYCVAAKLVFPRATAWPRFVDVMRSGVIEQADRDIINLPFTPTLRVVAGH